MPSQLESALHKLLAYCRANDWAGYEPYDGPDSRLFSVFPFLNSRLPRLVLTQGLKRLPFNPRPFLLISKSQNPKALAISLAALLKLAPTKLADKDGIIDGLLGRLVALRSPGSDYWCWGYSFGWQTRTVFVPRGTPNLICTYFAATSLLNVYEARGDSHCLAMAVSAAEYFLNELYFTAGDGVAGFSYPLHDSREKNQVHNAYLLAAALLCRIYKLTGQERFLSPALKAARYSAARQQPDGSWYYGESPTQQWIDNFHSGYNLSALRSIAQATGTGEFDERIRRGFEFFRKHFFREDGAVRYYHNRTYPIDSHCVAQSLLTLLEFSDLYAGSLALAQMVFDWAMDYLWDERGYFYNRRLRFLTNRVSYMRWTQAWMLLALATLYRETESGSHRAGSPGMDSGATQAK